MFPRSGALTFLFTDIEGSTRKAHELGENWFGVLQAHHDLLRPVFAAHGGLEVSTAGDSFFVVFDDALQALLATVAMQRVLAAHDWAPNPIVRVRMGLHTGPARFNEVDNDYAGLTVHAASRVESAAAGAQVLLTQATLDAIDKLPEELGVLDLGWHRLKDLPAELRIYQVVADGLPREFPPVRGLDVVRNNIPTPPSSFVGRTQVIARLHRLLDDDRLVTLVGTGGTGKTRLALQIATERLHRHPDGAWLVELADATDETGVVAAIAQVLGVREEREIPLLRSVIENLHASNVLLVVDNCEHVIDAAARVIEQLLRGGSGIRVLATSREALEIGGERTWPLAPMSVEADAAEQSEAVLLLVDRITRIQPDFILDHGLVPHAVAIVRRLDGLPLAIELAAASTASLSLDDVARQLDDRFALLTRGSRTALDRQKTLWGAIDWSYGLLDDDQQRLMRRLGVFPAEFDYGVMRKVCGEGLRAPDDTMEGLIRKSVVSERPSTRFRLLESIRAYARHQLEEADELAHFTERHAREFVHDADALDDGQTDWIDTIHEDLSAALEWGALHDDETQLGALVPLQQFWIRRGRLSEGRATTQRVLAATEGVASDRRRRALGNAGQLALCQGHAEEARSYFQQAVTVAAETEGPERAQLLLGDLGAIAEREGDLDTAEALYEQALAAAGEMENKSAIAICLTHLMQIAGQRGDLARAWNTGMEALDAARELEWLDLEFTVTNILGSVALQRDNVDEARRCFEGTLASARKFATVQPSLFALFGLATIEFRLGEHRAAALRLREAIVGGHDIGAEADLAESLELVAQLAARSDQAETGARLLVATDNLRTRLGFGRQPQEQVSRNELEVQLRAAMPTFDDTVAVVGNWSVDRVVDVALGFLETIK